MSGIINPDKYIRKSFVSALSPIWPTFDKMVPKNATIPAQRYVVTSQTKNQANTNKTGHDWNCTITIDIICEQELGYADTAILDDMEEQILNLFDTQGGSPDITPFTCYNTHVLTPTDLSYNTPTKSIGRKVFKMELQINGIYP